MRKLAEISKFQTKCGSAIEEYLNEKGEHSKNTEVSYKGDFQRFTEDVFGKSIDTITAEELDLIDYEIIMNYRKSMIKDVSNATVNRHMNTIKGIIKHLKTRKMLNVDTSYLDLIKKLPIKPVEIEHMPMEIVDKYVDEARLEKNHGELKQNVIRFAVDTGLRLEEVLAVELKQFKIDGDTVIFKGYGKGNKEYIDRISLSMYNDLLKTMTNKENPNGKIFAPLNTKNITDMMARIQKNLGLENREYSFHSFKKTAVTNTYRATGCILAAQKKGRHSNINTTRGYLKEEDFKITGMYSLRSMNYDEEAYKKIEYEELLNALEGMNKDFLHILNMKLSENT